MAELSKETLENNLINSIIALKEYLDEADREKAIKESAPHKTVDYKLERLRDDFAGAFIEYTCKITLRSYKNTSCIEVLNEYDTDSRLQISDYTCAKLEKIIDRLYKMQPEECFRFISRSCTNKTYDYLKSTQKVYEADKETKQKKYVKVEAILDDDENFAEERSKVILESAKKAETVEEKVEGIDNSNTLIGIIVENLSPFEAIAFFSGKIKYQPKKVAADLLKESEKECLLNILKMDVDNYVNPCSSILSAASCTAEKYSNMDIGTLANKITQTRYAVSRKLRRACIAKYKDSNYIDDYKKKKQ